MKERERERMTDKKRESKKGGNIERRKGRKRGSKKE